MPASPPPAPRRPEGGEREIESWLGELRGGAGDPPPSNAQTEAFTTPGKPPTPPPGAEAPEDATTAIPTQPESDDPKTEKLNARSEKGRRRGKDGLSAQELLRREGRY
ncbi:hypothetical protein [Mycobacterium sp. 1274756.6]|uniref:hypothetical protein n=1 Tax=Mycobacterium sp. 1274756.6 TaxID=1834076 RepID=UPI0012E803F5|nr:hypothetical protein [Mycobacterium sp. 1274756.6]